MRFSRRANAYVDDDIKEGVMEEELMHHVPNFALERIEKFAKLLRNRFEGHKSDEIRLNEALNNTISRTIEVNRQYEILITEQELYFKQESTMVNAILESNEDATISNLEAQETSLEFNFNHRKAISKATQDSFNLIAKAIDESSQTQLEIALEEAQNLEASKSNEILEQQQCIKLSRTEIDVIRGNIKHTMETTKVYAGEFEEWTDTVTAVVESDRYKWIKEEFGKWVEECHVVQYLFFPVHKCEPDYKTWVEHRRVERREYAGNIEHVYNLQCFAIDLQESLDLIKNPDFNLDNPNIGKDNETANNVFIKVLERGAKLKNVKKLTDDAFEEFKDGFKWVKKNLKNPPSSEVVERRLKTVLFNMAELGNEVREFSEAVLKFLEKKIQLETTIKNANLSTSLVNYISTKLKDLKQTQIPDYPKEKYEKTLDTFKDEYKQASKERKETMKQDLKKSFNELKEKFEDFKQSAIDDIDDTANALHKKITLRKQKSIEDKAMAMSVFEDYCSALFYHNFETCDSSNKPAHTDTIDTVIDKIDKMNWNILKQSDVTVQGKVPTKFEEKQAIIRDTKLDEPVKTLLEYKSVLINLKDYFPASTTKNAARFRIHSVQVYPQSKDGFTLASSESQKSTEEVMIGIGFPTKFTDQAPDGHKYTFYTSFPHYCRTAYIKRHGGNSKRYFFE